MSPSGLAGVCCTAGHDNSVVYSRIVMECASYSGDPGRIQGLQAVWTPGPSMKIPQAAGQVAFAALLPPPSILGAHVPP